jgi:anthranilate synthase component 1
MALTERDALSGVQVRLHRSTLVVDDAYRAFLALREALGPDEVYLLESLAGPTADRRAALIGFGPLLDVTVVDQVILVTGVPVLVARARERLLASGTVTERGEELLLVVREDLWQAVRAVAQTFVVEPGHPSRYSFGFLAFFGYDVASYVEVLPRRIQSVDGTPDVILRVYAGTAVFDLREGTAELILGQSDEWEPHDPIYIAKVLSQNPARSSREVPNVPTPLSVIDSTDQSQFSADVQKCLDHIGVGDIYQVQIGHEFSVRSEVDVLDVYARLRARNPSPYMCLLPLPGVSVVGASPELFIRIDGREIVMRPIAGTAPRSGDEVEDERRTQALAINEKERAEHVMLVDLCRNDLGRIARAKTVAVDEMMVIENFSHVFHLVSNIRAELRDGLDVYDAVAATFPAGTMTGAPKIRAMEIIEDTESLRRGYYAGAFGLIDFGGYVNLGLAIRTAFQRGQTWTTRASAGVVADSEPTSEWRETLAKMSATYWAITGQELL